MGGYFDYLQNPIIAGLVCGSLIVLFAYYDKWMNNRDFENEYFAKLFFSVGTISALLVYLVRGSGGSSETPVKMSGKHRGGGNSEGSGSGSGGGGSADFVKTKKISGGSEIYTDAPDF